MMMGLLEQADIFKLYMMITIHTEIFMQLYTTYSMHA